MSRIRGILAFASLCLMAAVSGEAATVPEESARFLQKAMEGSMVEIELGKLAQRNAATAGINALGSRIARDHRRIGKILQLISQDRGVAMPVSLTGDQQSIVDGLSLKTGAEFDAAYAEQMVTSHEKLITLFDEAASSSDADVAAFAKQALPVLREGKRLAEVYREVTSRRRSPVQAQAVAQTG